MKWNANVSFYVKLNKTLCVTNKPLYMLVLFIVLSTMKYQICIEFLFNINWFWNEALFIITLVYLNKLPKLWVVISVVCMLIHAFNLNIWLINCKYLILSLIGHLFEDHADCNQPIWRSIGAIGWDSWFSGRRQLGNLGTKS